MKTMYLAPLGMQPGGVVAPLLSLGLTQGDEIVLLTTAAVEELGISSRSQSLLGERLPATVVRSADITGDLPDLAGFERVILLINGGEAVTVHQLADRLRAISENHRVEFAESRGVNGTVFGWDGAPTRTFEVRDIGVDSLLTLLHVEISPDGKKLVSLSNRARFLGVEEILERAGALYACVPVDAAPAEKDPHAINSARLAAYRALLRWQTLQQDLGLELRRLLLTCSSTPRYPGDTWPQRLRRRAERDGIPVVGRMLHGYPLDLAQWMDCVLAGSAPSLPEQLDAPQPKSGRALTEMKGNGLWTGPTVFMVAGTQPGTVLRALWAHRARCATLFYDPDSPGVLRNLDRLRIVVSKSGAQRIDAVPLTRLGVTRPDTGSHVSLSAGDKSTKFRIKLWAEQHQVPVCYLAGTKVTCGDSVEHVPLRSWLQAHTTLLITFGTQPKSQPHPTSDTQSIKAARVVWNALSNGQSLGRKGEPPGEAHAAIQLACGRVRAEGFWLEDLAESLVRPCCEETVMGAELRVNRGDEHFEDELDL